MGISSSEDEEVKDDKVVEQYPERFHHHGEEEEQYPDHFHHHVEDYEDYDEHRDHHVTGRTFWCSMCGFETTNLDSLMWTWQSERKVSFCLDWETIRTFVVW